MAGRNAQLKVWTVTWGQHPSIAAAGANRYRHSGKQTGSTFKLAVPMSEGQCPPRNSRLGRRKTTGGCPPQCYLSYYVVGGKRASE